MNARHLLSRETGFSLVEIAMAVGIIAFAFVGLYGLLPVGLDQFSNAMDATVRSQIVQRLITEVQQTDFTKISGEEALPMRYFDSEGSEVEKPALAIYNADARVLQTTTFPEGSISRNLLRVTVRVARNPGQLPDPFEPATKLSVSSHTAFVPRSE